MHPCRLNCNYGSARRTGQSAAAGPCRGSRTAGAQVEQRFCARGGCIFRRRTGGGCRQRQGHAAKPDSRGRRLNRGSVRGANEAGSGQDAATFFDFIDAGETEGMRRHGTVRQKAPARAEALMGTDDRKPAFHPERFFILCFGGESRRILPAHWAGSCRVRLQGCPHRRF